MKKTLSIFSLMVITLISLVSCGPLEESATNSDSLNSSAFSLTKQGSVNANEWNHYGPYIADTAGITVDMIGTDDADLYVKKGLQPTISDYDCRPYVDGSTESCSLSGSGTYYVSVRGYATISNYEITVDYNEQSAGGNDPIYPTSANLALGATAHSSEGTGTANLNDGTDYTSWKSDAYYYSSNNVWVQLSWNNDIDMDFMEIKWQGSFYAYSFDVWAHVNGSWTNLGRENANGTTSQVNLDVTANSLWISFYGNNNNSSIPKYFEITDIIVE